MSFKNIMRDRIKLLKSNGEVIDGLKASVQDGAIHLMQSDVFVEPNDLVQRDMSNGGMETFRVNDPGFHEGSGHGIPAHYQMKVTKLGLPEAEKAVQSITYNISGPNARVNNHSVDNSTNIININTEVAEQLSMLRQEIQRLVEDESGKKEALEIVDAIEGQFESENPSKTVVRTLVSSLPAAGSIASIGSFLVSLLGG